MATEDDARETVMPPAAAGEDDLRALAVQRLRKRADFRTHVLVYVLVNAFVVLIWFVTGGPFFWPIFPILGWGVGLVMNAWDVYRRDPSRRSGSGARCAGCAAERRPAADHPTPSTSRRNEFSGKRGTITLATAWSTRSFSYSSTGGRRWQMHGWSSS